MHRRDDDPQVEIIDVTDDYAVIGLWGPCARHVLQEITADDVSNEAFPYMTAKGVDVNGIEVLAQRVTYVGELGWELYIPTDKAIFVWDRLWAAGQGYQMAACGYKAIDALRLEKGFLALTSDITALENPYEARLDFCVKLQSGGDFIGRQALEQVKAEGIKQRLYTFTIGDEAYLPLYGGEAVVSEGKVLTRLRSAGYGYTVRKNIGYAYLPIELAGADKRFDIEIFGEMVPAQVVPDVLYDPKGEALRK